MNAFVILSTSNITCDAVGYINASGKYIVWDLGGYVWTISHNPRKYHASVMAPKIAKSVVYFTLINLF